MKLKLRRSAHGCLRPHNTFLCAVYVRPTISLCLLCRNQLYTIEFSD